MEPLVIHENVKKQYDIEFVESFETLGDKIKALCPKASKVYLITDSNVDKLYSGEVIEYLRSFETKKYVIPAGEDHKNVNTISAIINELFDFDITRSDVIIGLGGGVTLDIAGFAASIFKRGIPFLSLPTTLLSMADASVGGKDGINFKGTKNIIGSFYSPVLIMMNLNTLHSLDDRNYFAGFAEIMKAGLIMNSKFYMWLIENMYEICAKENAVLTEMLSTAISIKKSVVEKDPYEETGERMLLNFGHTIGHGIEAVCKDEYIHGECVSLGIVAASYISYKMNFISSDEYYEIRDMLVPFYLPISISTDKTEEIFNAILKDKKNTATSIRMALLKRVGKAFICDDVSKDFIKEAIEELNFKEED